MRSLNAKGLDRCFQSQVKCSTPAPTTLAGAEACFAAATVWGEVVLVLHEWRVRSVSKVGDLQYQSKGRADAP